MLQPLRILTAGILLALIVPGCKSRPDATMETRNIPGIEVRPGSAPSMEYKGSVTRQFDLIHTSLEVKFNYQNQTMPGKAVVTLRPHFYPSDTLSLDARSMLIHRVALLQGKDTLDTKYIYVNEEHLVIVLNKTYTKDDTLSVYVEYTAQPEELKKKEAGSAVRDDKGLYFINPLKEIQGLPRQVWTQSEPQSAAVWFPTLDAPNQKMTQQIRITADNSDVTLSNGIMISSTNNQDGTHTDTWRMDLPHAPYLVMMAVGPFEVIKDSWRGREVSYYVEPEYKNVAQRIFGNTPEMMELFSNKLGVDYPWAKYSQIVVREFVSGAMENTSATVHMDGLQRNERQLIDETNEDYVSHELFHQWFGDLVTCESWSNTPLNESFATYGEYIWKDYKYGREEADYSRAFDLNVYLRESKTKQVNLIRFEYDKIDDMFDRHSYQKGGCILHLLRKELGDDAFFASLKLYLEKNKFQPVEVHNLRLAFEEVTGRDLNWFFNQWFMDRGHPVLDITYHYDASAKNVTVTIRQQQDTSGIRLFRLNLETDIYLANSVEHKKIVVTKKEETFTFPVNEKPLLVNVDATKTLVGQKFDYHSAAEWLYQYYHAPLYLDRLEAVKAVPDNYAANSPEAKLILDAANDKHWHIRTTAIKKIKLPAHPDSTELQKLLMNIARNDSKSSVRAAAINKLNEQFSGNSLTGFYKELLNDSSYLVMTAAMEALSERDSTAALAFALKQEQSKELEIIEMNSGLYANYGNANQANYMHQIIQNANNDNLYSLLGNYGDYIIRQSDEKILNKGIDVLGDKAKNAQPWYNRFAAMQSLAELSSTLQNKKADAVRKNIVLEQEKFSTLLQKCSDSMASIMKAETDPSLRRIYDNSNQK